MNKLAPHFFVSSSDGGLYDTRRPKWNQAPPLRAVYNRQFSRIENTLQLRATLRAGAHAWPGGYPLYFITSDGGALSFETVQNNLRAVCWSVETDGDDLFISVNRASDSYPIGELICTSHRALSPIRDHGEAIFTGGKI